MGDAVAYEPPEEYAGQRRVNLARMYLLPAVNALDGDEPMEVKIRTISYFWRLYKDIPYEIRHNRFYVSLSDDERRMYLRLLDDPVYGSIYEFDIYRDYIRLATQAWLDGRNNVDPIQSATRFWRSWRHLNNDARDVIRALLPANEQARFDQLMAIPQFMEVQQAIRIPEIPMIAVNRGERRGNAVAYQAPANQPRVNRQGGGKRRRKSKTRRSTKRRTTRKH